ncbi:MAG: DMT family transporter [Ahrensia sp.]|nr:DMT family transporter [Ahrensia sp.]
MDKKDRIDAFGASSLIGFSLLLGLNQVMIKIVNGGLQPVFQAGLRSLLAFPIVVLIALIFRQKLAVNDGSLWPGLLSGVFFGGEFILLFLALDYTSVARASIFFYTMPFWVALGAHFLIAGERLNGQRIAGLLLAIAGVALALSGNAQPVSDLALVGDILCLFGAMMWAGIALLARTTSLSKSTPYMQLVYQLAVSAPMILLAALFFGPFIRDLQPYHLGLFAFQVIVIVSMGFAFWFWLLSKYPASDMASFGFLAPLFGVAFGWLILDEPVGPRLIAALLLVAIGIVLVNRRPKSKASATVNQDHA